MTLDQVTIPVSVPQYFLSHVHLAQCWAEKRVEELAWFEQSIRGELPPTVLKPKNYRIQHIVLPKSQYYLALEALTTHLGVKLS